MPIANNANKNCITPNLQCRRSSFNVSNLVAINSVCDFGTDTLSSTGFIYYFAKCYGNFKKQFKKGCRFSVLICSLISEWKFANFFLTYVGSSIHLSVPTNGVFVIPTKMLTYFKNWYLIVKTRCCNIYFQDFDSLILWHVKRFSVKWLWWCTNLFILKNKHVFLFLLLTFLVSM